MAKRTAIEDHGAVLAQEIKYLRDYRESKDDLSTEDAVRLVTAIAEISERRAISDVVTKSRLVDRLEAIEVAMRSIVAQSPQQAYAPNVQQQQYQRPQSQPQQQQQQQQIQHSADAQPLFRPPGMGVS